MSPVDLVLVEGFKHESYPKIEVYRAGLDEPPLARSDATVVALADDGATPDIPEKIMRLDANDPAAVADFHLRAPVGAVPYGMPLKAARVGLSATLSLSTVALPLLLLLRPLLLSSEPPLPSCCSQRSTVASRGPRVRGVTLGWRCGSCGCGSSSASVRAKRVASPTRPRHMAPSPASDSAMVMASKAPARLCLVGYALWSAPTAAFLCHANNR